MLAVFGVDFQKAEKSEKRHLNNPKAGNYVTVIYLSRKNISKASNHITPVNSKKNVDSTISLFESFSSFYFEIFRLNHLISRQCTLLNYYSNRGQSKLGTKFLPNNCWKSNIFSKDVTNSDVL